MIQQLSVSVTVTFMESRNKRDFMLHKYWVMTQTFKNVKVVFIFFF